ncbi:unnamed protein product, partial [Schistosoma mattheei]
KCLSSIQTIGFYEYVLIYKLFQQVKPFSGVKRLKAYGHMGKALTFTTIIYGKKKLLFIYFSVRMYIWTEIACKYFISIAQEYLAVQECLCIQF